MTRLLRFVALALIVLLAAGWGAAWVSRAPGETWPNAFARLLTGGTAPVPPTAGGLSLSAGTSLGGPFTLVDQTGKTVTDADYRGKVVVIFFGYSFCPDVCPTELSVVASAMDLLGADADRVQPLFVSVDPERDTPAKLADYVALFHPRIAGLTGTPEQVAAAARAFRVYYAKTTPPGAGEYLMDHSAFTYLLGPDGKLRTLFRPGVTPEQLAEAVRSNLG
ncbi:SCO family protein [Roseomonas sp. BN140053]|uniref:SCO family protein n=1 Tax=Roseomonas sp. BN140053 TaxID=3391898 RepID=UPI0039EA9846